MFWAMELKMDEKILLKKYTHLAYRITTAVVSALHGVQQNRALEFVVFLPCMIQFTASLNYCIH